MRNGVQNRIICNVCIYVYIMYLINEIICIFYLHIVHVVSTCFVITYLCRFNSACIVAMLYMYVIPMASK